MINYVDCCRTLEILKQDSGLLPKPREDWNTFVPAYMDIAHVDENDTDYIFNGVEWVVYVEGEPVEEQHPVESTEEEPVSEEEEPVEE